MSALEQYASNAAHVITTTPLPTMSQFLRMADCVKARESQLAAIIQEHAINPAVKELVDALEYYAAAPWAGNTTGCWHNVNIASLAESILAKYKEAK